MPGSSSSIGIPGTIGGAVRMNAGAFGGETGDRLVWAEALDRSGRLHRLSAAELGISYRHSALPAGWIVLRAAFSATGEAARDAARNGRRSGTSARRRSRCGSPPAAAPSRTADGRKAWQLIDQAGCRGLRHGARHGVGEALQLPDQYRRCHGG